MPSCLGVDDPHEQQPAGLQLAHGQLRNEVVAELGVAQGHAARGVGGGQLPGGVHHDHIKLGGGAQWPPVEPHHVRVHGHAVLRHAPLAWVQRRQRGRVSLLVALRAVHALGVVAQRHLLVGGARTRQRGAVGGHRSLQLRVVQPGPASSRGSLTLHDKCLGHRRDEKLGSRLVSRAAQRVQLPTAERERHRVRQHTSTGPPSTRVAQSQPWSRCKLSTHQPGLVSPRLCLPSLRRGGGRAEGCEVGVGSRRARRGDRQGSVEGPRAVLRK